MLSGNWRFAQAKARRALATGGKGQWAERAPALPDLQDATAASLPNRFVAAG